jgi:small subunit ribosomal protein S8
MMTDPVADFLTRIRNAQMVKHKTLTCPSSKMKARIAEILKNEGYIEDFKVEINAEKRAFLTLTLRYDDRDAPVIEGIGRVSKPGLRKYSSADDLPRVRGGLGMAIISTSRGIMTDAQARKERVGGEVVCTVY